jgi:hypothetical protein
VWRGRAAPRPSAERETARASRDHARHHASGPLPLRDTAPAGRRAGEGSRIPIVRPSLGHGDGAPIGPLSRWRCACQALRGGLHSPPQCRRGAVRAGATQVASRGG